MKFEEAMSIIDKKEKTGFMVSFEVRERGILRSDYFPDKHDGEPLIQTEEEAWDLAKRFGSSTDDNHVNIYVIDSSFSPVMGYEQKKLKRY